MTANTTPDGADERKAMRSEDVPQDLVLAAAWALADFPETDEGDGTDEVRVMLAAVLPLYGQQQRARAETAEAALETLRGQIGEPEWGLATIGLPPSRARTYGVGDERRRDARAAQQQYQYLVTRLAAGPWREAEEGGGGD